MSLKAQGTDLNRTSNAFIAPADIGAFNRSSISFVLKGDAARKIRITGFEFTHRVGIAADVNANSFLEVALIETSLITGETTQAFIYPDFGAAVRFYFAGAAINFQNDLREQFLTPFKLVDGINYTLVASYTSGGGALAATATEFLTVFGFEETPEEKSQSYYKKPR